MILHFNDLTFFFLICFSVCTNSFTVVFGVFIVPIPVDTKFLKLNDSVQNCLEHMQRRMMNNLNQKQ